MTPEEIRAHKSGMFATCDSIDDLIDRYNMRGANVAIMMIAVNTALEILAQEATKTCESNGEHLDWIYTRLITVHGENRNVDYMQKFKEIIDDYFV